jgi:uncharacterized protein YecE (DUF72 family)
VQEYVGHSSISTTMGYLKIDQNEAFNKVKEAIISTEQKCMMLYMQLPKSEAEEKF